MSMQPIKHSQSITWLLQPTRKLAADLRRGVHLNGSIPIVSQKEPNMRDKRL